MMYLKIPHFKLTVKRKPKRSYGGLSAETRDKQRREQLIVAAIDRFGTRGYSAATIESVCTQARVSTRDFYSYFATKEELMLAAYDRIVEESMRQVGDAVAAAFEQDADSGDVIRAGIAAFATAMVEDERWARINFIEVIGVSQRVEHRRREVIGDFGRLVAAISEVLAERGEFDREKLSHVHSIAMVGAVHETLTDWVIHTERPPLTETIDALVEIFSAVLRG